MMQKEFRPNTYWNKSSQGNDGQIEEVEIAAVITDSMIGNRISFLAKKHGPRITYRATSSDIDDWKISPEESSNPLSLNEMINLIDTALPIGEWPDANGLVLEYLDRNYEMGGSLESLRGFVLVDSDYYPQLSLHYDELIEAWFTRRRQEEAISLDEEARVAKELKPYRKHARMARIEKIGAANGGVWGVAVRFGDVMQYVREYFDAEGKLPEGRHTIRGRNGDFFADFQEDRD